MTWTKISRNGLSFYQDSNLNNDQVVQAYSSRDCGDLGLAGPARLGPVLQRRRRFLETLNLKLTDLVATQQVHGNQVRLVDQSHAGAGSGLGLAPLAQSDALITASTGVVLSIYTADCLALFIYDPQTPAVALIHAGWRGSLQQIAAATMATLIQKLGTDPSHCWAAIGPGLCRNCFQVQPQLASEFEQNWPAAVWQDQSGCRVDLVMVNREQLVAVGIKPERINDSGSCTCCHGEGFFSYRGQSGTTKRMMALISLKS